MIGKRSQYRSNDRNNKIEDVVGDAFRGPEISLFIEGLEEEVTRSMETVFEDIVRKYVENNWIDITNGIVDNISRYGDEFGFNIEMEENLISMANNYAEYMIEKIVGALMSDMVGSKSVYEAQLVWDNLEEDVVQTLIGR